MRRVNHQQAPPARFAGTLQRLTPRVLREIDWLPSTCAYRLIDEGLPLPDWHPLLTGDPESVHKAGISVRGWTVSEDEAGDLEHHLVDRDL